MIERVLAVGSAKLKRCTVQVFVNDVLAATYTHKFAGTETADQFFRRLCTTKPSAMALFSQIPQDWVALYSVKAIDEHSGGITIASSCYISCRAAHYEVHFQEPNFDSAHFESVGDDRSLRESIRVFDDRLSQEDLRKSFQKMSRPDGGCANCGSVEPRHLCTCNAVRYCGRECQKVHWKAVHKAECRTTATSTTEDAYNQAQAVENPVRFTVSLNTGDKRTYEVDASNFDGILQTMPAHAEVEVLNPEALNASCTGYVVRHRRGGPEMSGYTTISAPAARVDTAAWLNQLD